MATLILTAVGTAIGGPIGGAIGAIIGQRADQAIFAPKGRQGPRLGDLGVQTSSYGAAIPRLFGRVRVAGTVIWATDLKETRHSQSNGKGRPKTETYSYSTSFAVALSVRRITGIGRIWADGNLLRGAAGDFKTETGFRLYRGDENQPLDPLIASAQGIAATPAYRGIAYAVFENLQLGDFGNRIPSLSFEVFADPAAVGAGDVLGELAGADHDPGPLLLGIAATGDSARGVAEMIGAALPFACVDGRVRFADGPIRPIADTDLGAASDGRPGRKRTIDQAAAARSPVVLTLAYYDADRDYQPGSQRARRDGSGRREERLDLPVTLNAGAAKTIAEGRLATLIGERTRATLVLPWRAIDLACGDRVMLPGLGGGWRIAATAFEAMTVRLDVVRTGGAMIVHDGESGANLAQADRLHGPTGLVAIDLPAVDEPPATGARVVIAANGSSGAWRRAALLASLDGGQSWRTLGGTALPATMGTAATALPNSSGLLIDRRDAVEVSLIHEDLMLNDADEAALMAGANAAMLGDELIQFGSAAPLGGGRWRLSELWRGRRGTEWATGGHLAGEPFVLLESDALFTLPAEFAVPGAKIMAAGIGDATGVVIDGPARPGAAVRPLSPSHMEIREAGGGDMLVTWIRRSRDGWRWSDGVDAPIGEEQEHYRMTRTPAVGAVATIETGDCSWTYPAAMRAADIAAGAASVTFAVSQVGGGGVSPAATISFNL